MAKAKSVPPLLQLLREHFRETDLAVMPVIEQTFAFYERPNLHLAIEQLLTSPGRKATLVGIVVQHDYESPTLAKLSRPSSSNDFDIGPVEYTDVALDNDKRLACVKRGLYRFYDDDGGEGEPLALLIHDNRYAHPPNIAVEVMGGRRDRAENFARVLSRQTRLGTAYRGKVLSISQDCFRQLQVEFHRLPQISREQIILPEKLLQRIERHTLSFSRNADKLRAAGRHIKRGILLHGPPGTGKTLSAMYLAAQMPGRTVLLMTGAGMGSIETACTMARMLEPSTVILEDVDLIGTEREHQTVSANALLFELLNQMDGLAEDVDVLFILTTNRPDVLEPALASRPGRIDQAIEVPPPDADCRRRLLDLYSRGMRVELSDRDDIVRRTEGASGAFIRELLRKAAVYAAEDDGASSNNGELVVRDQHVNEGLAELLVAGGPLTRSLLGKSDQAKSNS